ncbi:MAG: GtrA family protein [Chloroflexi bacterium]|nr:GtrA family protein [Chloroflexota bacterium]
MTDESHAIAAATPDAGDGLLWRLLWPLIRRMPPMVQRNLHEVKIFLKFAVVGTTGAIVDLGLLNVMHLFVWHDTWDIMLYPAVTISFSAAVLNNYTWNILWTYNHQDHSDQHHITLSKFFIVSVIGLLINLSIVYLMTDILGFYWLIGKLLAMLIVLFWNFAVNRLWTFNQ